MALGTAAGIGVGIAGLAGIGNFLANASASDRAKAILDKNFQDWMALKVPDPEQQKIVLQQFVNQGTLSPVLQSAIKADPSGFSKITTSVGNQIAQNKALSSLQDIGESGGLRLQDKAALQDALIKSETQARGARDSIVSDMARRGQAGSGFEVAARIGGNQQSQDALANASLKTASDANGRALDAIMKGGELGTQYRNQDFQEQAQKANATDRINQFNTTNLRDVNAANTGLENRAQEMNLAQKQKTADQNTNVANQQEQYNKGLIQQNYDNQLKRLSGASGQAGALANQEQKSGALVGNAFSNTGNAGVGIASAASNQDFWDKYFQNQQNKGNANVTIS